jgi:uncharacterized protein (TIGR00369 family)
MDLDAISPNLRNILKVMEERSPFNRLLGLKGEWIEPGRAVLVIPARPDLVGDPRRPALHGGVVAALVDTVGGAAAWSAASPEEAVSTVDLSVDYLEPAGLGGPLRGEGVVVRKGSRVCHVRMSVTQDGVLVAEGRGVYNLGRKRAADPWPPG